MMASGESDRSAKPGAPPVLALCLWALAIISVVLGLAAALVTIFTAAHAGIVGLTTTILAAVLYFAAGCCVAGVLCALAWLCLRQRQQGLLEQRIALALERLAGAPAQVGRPGIGGGPPGAAQPLAPAYRTGRSAEVGKGGLAGTAAERPEADPLLEEIRELNINLLLSDSQRQIKRRYFTQRQAQRLTQEIERAIASGDLGRADECLDRLRRVGPDLPGIGELSERLEQARTRTQARDVGEAKRRVEELMSVSGFATAVAVVNGLLAKHPSSAEAIALMERVRREREAFVNEQRLAMYQKVEKEASSRRWRDALSAAEELLSAYPDSPEADAVRARMDTLRENARIEEVRRLRDRVSDLISRRQFAQAIEVAKDVIARFPGTAAARELHEQMAKLEELGRAAPGAGQ